MTGRVASAAHAAARAWTLAQRCEGARTPALRNVVAQLSQREHQIAQLAANGLTSPQIADRLVVSRCTVDNHLQSIYTKLGVRRREQLRDVITPP